MKLLSALVCAVTLVGLAAPAHGDPASDDAAFLAALRNAGLTFNNPARAITSAHAVCGFMSNGETGLQVVTDIKNQNPALTLDGAALFATIACSTYCPEHVQPAGGYF